MLLKKAILALGAAVVGLLVIEGAISLTAGRSFLREHGAVLVPQRTIPEPPTDAERLAGAGRQYYVTHEDPFVRYVHRPEAELTYVGAPASIDAHGMRARPGGDPPDDALRVVVLGDSIAFGFGVADDETIAARLEETLDAARGPDVAPVAALTIAVPSWNHRAALHYLIDHFDRLRPDLVVYVPVVNDLSDQASVYGTGDMRLSPDVAAADPFLIVNRSQAASLENRLRPIWRQAGHDDPALGPRAVEADLTPESGRRYDENADSIVAMHRLLARRGARLVVAQSGFGEYARHLAVRLADRAPSLPVWFLERSLPVERTLVVNNHPNADTLRARALHLAARLLDEGLVDPGAGNPVPAPPADWVELLAGDVDVGMLQVAGERSRAQALEQLRPMIDLSTGEGFRQVLGGLNLDGSVRLHAAAVLAAEGDVLRVLLEPFPHRPDLYPLRVAVDVDGEPVGEIVVGAERPEPPVVPLPPSLAGSGRPFEVRLRPERWVVVDDRGRSQVASCRLRRLDARP